MKYRAKKIIEANQWHKNGDHPQDNCPEVIVSAECAKQFPDVKEGDTFKGEGRVVRYYRHPAVSGENVCEKCGNTMHNHGWIDSENSHQANGETVCPSDFIITDDLSYFRLSAKDFNDLYEPVE